MSKDVLDDGDTVAHGAQEKSGDVGPAPHNNGDPCRRGLGPIPEWAQEGEGWVPGALDPGGNSGGLDPIPKWVREVG